MYYPSRSMQLIKNIPQEKSLKNTLRSKKIFGDELLIYWGYIGTVVNGTVLICLKTILKIREIKKKKDQTKQMKIFDLASFL
jgi:hypothetical protein